MSNRSLANLLAFASMIATGVEPRVADFRALVDKEVTRLCDHFGTDKVTLVNDLAASTALDAYLSTHLKALLGRDRLMGAYLIEFKDFNDTDLKFFVNVYKVVTGIVSPCSAEFAVGSPASGTAGAVGGFPDLGKVAPASAAAFAKVFAEELAAAYKAAQYLNLSHLSSLEVIAGYVVGSVTGDASFVFMPYDVANIPDAWNRLINGCLEHLAVSVRPTWFSSIDGAALPANEVTTTISKASETYAVDFAKRDLQRKKAATAAEASRQTALKARLDGRAAARAYLEGDVAITSALDEIAANLLTDIETTGGTQLLDAEGKPLAIANLPVYTIAGAKDPISGADVTQAIYRVVASVKPAWFEHDAEEDLLTPVRPKDLAKKMLALDKALAGLLAEVPAATIRAALDRAVVRAAEAAAASAAALAAAEAAKAAAEPVATAPAPTDAAPAA